MDRHYEVARGETSLLGDILREIKASVPDLWDVIREVSAPNPEEMVATALVVTEFKIGQKFMREGVRPGSGWFGGLSAETYKGGIPRSKIDSQVFHLQNASAEWVPEFMGHLKASGEVIRNEALKAQAEQARRQLEEQLNKELAGIAELADEQLAKEKAIW